MTIILISCLYSPGIDGCDLILLQYTWTDDSPYIYDNHANLSMEDNISILKTTLHKPHKLTGRPNSLHYYEEFKQKFSYVSKNNFTDNSGACTAVFLSYLTTPAWVPVSCEILFKQNYFLCEKRSHLKITEHAYHHRSIACQKNYTFIDGFCWIISSTHSHGFIYETELSLLDEFLSAWSLGQKSRTIIKLYNIRKHVRFCLRTNDFEYQHIKEWTVTQNCSTKYTLLNRNALNYHQICAGMYL